MQRKRANDDGQGEECDNRDPAKCRNGKNGQPCPCSCHIMAALAGEIPMGGDFAAALMQRAMMAQQAQEVGMRVLGHFAKHVDGVIILSMVEIGQGHGLDFLVYATGGQAMRDAQEGRAGKTQAFDPAVIAAWNNTK